MGGVPAIEPPTLRDGDLTLRPPLPGDAEAVTAACQDPAIQRWTFVPSPYRREPAEAWPAAAPECARAGESVSLLALGGDRRLAGYTHTGEVRRAPRGDRHGPAYAVYAWEA